MSARKLLFARLTYFLLALALAIWSAACGTPTASTENPDPAVSEASPPEPEPGKTVSLRMYIPAYPPGFEIPISFFETFMQANPDIMVEVIYIPLVDFRAKIQTDLAAGVLPDMALLGYNELADLYVNGIPLKLNDLDIANSGIILAEALDAARFEGALVGLPWLRYSCSPEYASFALFPPAEEKLDAAYRLLRFLFQEGIQQEIFFNRSWYPTLANLYQVLNLICDQVPVLRTPPGEVLKNIQVMEAEAELFNQFLVPYHINPANASAVFEEGNVILRAAPVFENPPPNSLGAAPLFSNARQALLLQTQASVSVGVLVIERDTVINGSYSISRGTYAVRCSNTGTVMCDLLDANGRVAATVPPILLETNVAPVAVPQVYAAADNSTRYCWKLDGLTICLRVG